MRRDKKPFQTVGDVLSSPWGAARSIPEVPVLTDRVLKSTRLEDAIYSDLRTGDTAMDGLETKAVTKLASLPNLSRDVYQSFYSLMPRRNDPETLSVRAKKCNAPILEQMMGAEDYPVLKDVCEGRELPAYEAASEFIQRIAGDLDTLLSETCGGQNALSTLEKLEAAKSQAEQDLSGLLEQRELSCGNETLDKAVVDAANRAESKGRQAEAVSKRIDTHAAQSREAVGAIVSAAVESALERAGEVESIISAWSDAPANMERSPVNLELLAQVRKSPVLKDVAKYLGRFREIFAQGKKNGYAYGRGEKYSLELGRDLSRVITSELAMLASPATLPLFLQKYQREQLKQYQRREPVYKGMGDIICCLDESNSTQGDPAAWGKAVAMTLLEIAADGGRKFALIHFSGAKSCQTDLFLPGAYTAQDKLAAAETFLDGGTNFETPMREALGLMAGKGFENADVIFITDGVCALPDAFLEELHAAQSSAPFQVTGVLLDQGSPGMDFSLKSFCQKIYRTSELMGEDIMRELVAARV